MQRIEYDDPKGFGTNTLLAGVIKFLVKEHTHPKNIYAALSRENRDMKFCFALSVLAHFRDNKRLTHDDVQTLTRGTYLRKDARDDVLEKLQDLHLISSWRTKRGAILRKNLFAEQLQVGR